MSPLQSGVTVTGLCVALACMTGLVACPQAVPAVVPVASCVAKVTDDALKGMTIAQIVADAGPGCVVDAEEVIAILLGSKDPRVAGTPAFKASVVARAPHATP